MKLAACLALTLTVISKTEPVHLEVNPKQGFAPMTVRAKVTIEPNYLNTAMCLNYQSVSVDGDEGEESTNCKTIDGQYAPKTFWFDIPLRVGGTYAFQAVVAQGPKYEVSKTVQVYAVPQGH